MWRRNCSTNQIREAPQAFAWVLQRSGVLWYYNEYGTIEYTNENTSFMDFSRKCDTVYWSSNLCGQIYWFETVTFIFYSVDFYYTLWKQEATGEILSELTRTPNPLLASSNILRRTEITDIVISLTCVLVNKKDKWIWDNNLDFVGYYCFKDCVVFHFQLTIRWHENSYTEGQIGRP